MNRRAVPTVLKVSPQVDSPRTTERKFRPELQGLRAVAALLVVVYHVWLDRISGGVDVFFVISGFLITGQLVRARLRGGIEFRAFWGRMIKRLFPAALFVLVATMVAALLWLPEHRWFQTIREVVASALYLENWQLAADSADYFARSNSVSVVQHFWSLSIQGQFYLVWPPVLALVGFVAYRRGWSLRWSVFGAIGALGAISLAYSVWLTAADQPLAYFTSLTRVWEFALGGLLALVIDRVPLPRVLRILLGWIGLFGLVSCGLFLQVGTVFPGHAALWPTMSAVFVLLAGATGSRVGADRLLSSRPLAYLGNLGYALYLWHWPVLIFYLLVRERTEIGVSGGAAVIGTSLVLAAITYHVVEQPARDSKIGVAKPGRAYGFGVAMLVPVLVAAGAWQLVATQRASFALELDDPDHPGAQVIPNGAPTLNPEKSIVPPFAALEDQYDRFAEEDCESSPRLEDLVICTVDPPGRPTKRLAVIGDSHAQQYIAALRPLVEKRGWQIISMGKGGCAFTANSDWPDCRDWNEAVLDQLRDARPDAVLTMASRGAFTGLKERTPQDYVTQWQRTAELGIPIVALRDNPRYYEFEPSACVQSRGPEDPSCVKLRAEFYAQLPPYASARGVPPTVSFVDLTHYFCVADKCPPVIGNVLLYLDNNHITAAYLRTMAPAVEEAVVKALRW